MEFTGTELTLKRSFYTQSGYYGFVADITVDNTSGLYKFGLTGDGGLIEFKLSGGKLFYENQFISTYRSYVPFSIEGQFNSGYTNLIKDGEALLYNYPKTSGYVNYFYMTRQNDGMGATFDVDISGTSLPSYSITNQGYLLSSGQDKVTGYFVNLGAFPIKVFDTTTQETQNYTFDRLSSSINKNATGTFAYGAEWNDIDLTQPILTTFATNYQDISILFTIIDARTFSKFVYITGPTDFSFNGTGVLARDLTYINYSGGVATTDYDASLVFRLQYTGGPSTFSGVWSMSTGLTPNNLVPINQFDTNMISGSGMFSPNSYVSFVITHLITGSVVDSAYLTISGADVLNPITQILSDPS